MYEVKFMMGVLAAMFAENHQIGYLAGTPTYGTIANINAFSIGAAMADPYSKIHIAWRSQKNTDWRRQLQEAGISVFSDQDFPSESDKSSPYGLYAYNEDGSLMPLARPLWNWGRYYEIISLSLLQGTYDIPALSKKDRALNYWLGLSAGVVDILPDPDLPYATRNLLDMMRNSLLAGSLTPFSGELHSQTEIIRKAGDPPLSRQEILTMEWLNENVVGTIPETGTLDIYARSVAAVSGVKTAASTASASDSEEEH
jgi:basic membrane lipoprotein Med (substrate-binding protein (PBP1-ABC) superfamily)